LEVQALLLRALETGEVQPVGASQTATVNVRVLAATDEDLDAAVAEGRMRSALYFRLAGSLVRVPPLRERRVDAGLLLAHFLRQQLQASDHLHLLHRDETEPPWLPAELVSLLIRHRWPGNVRQLQSVVRQLVAAHRCLETIDTEHIAACLEPMRSRPTISEPEAPSLPGRPGEISEDQLVEVLRGCLWRVGPAAAALGIPTATLHRMIEKSTRLRRAKDIPREELQRCYVACGGDVDAMAAKLEVSPRGIKLRLKELGL
jgi:two-component system nitrogen regulation response regulator GlnG